MTGQHVVVVGGGPAGLMAAETLAAAGLTVTVVDQMSSVGRKLLLAGRGGLNLTNDEPADAFVRRYTGSVQVASAIERFTPGQLRDWAEDLGQETFVGTSGRVFPKSLDSRPLLRAWIARLRTLGVQFHRARLLGLRADPIRLQLDAGLPTAAPGGVDGTATGGEARESTIDAVILALGGASWPRLGSDGSWIRLLGAHGVAAAPLAPSNCGWIVDWPSEVSERFAGQPLKNLAATAGGLVVRGEALIDAHGIEGGVVYALGPQLRAAHHATGQATLRLDLRPDTPVAKLTARLAAMPASTSLSNRLRRLGLAPQASALVRITLREEGAERTPTRIADAVKHVVIRLREPMPIDRAISTAGGIKAESLDGRWMLRRLPGVFAAGEMLDWDAPTGGYLLQACFATGRAAADGALDWLGSLQA